MSVWDDLPQGVAVLRQHLDGGGTQGLLLLGATLPLKRSGAFAFAAGVVCRVEPGVGCGECSACARVLRRRHPDVHHILPEGAVIAVDVIRDGVISEAARSPFEAASKVFVIEEAERMHPSAQNALLKTLEEPEADTFFVLIVEREDELLDTIHSRCRVVRVSGASEDELVALLTAEGASEDAARAAARSSEGDAMLAREILFDEAVRERRRTWLSLPQRLTSPRAALDIAAEIADVVASTVKEKEAEQKAEAAELADAMGERRGSAHIKNALVKRHRRELRRLEEELYGEAFSTLATYYRDIVAIRGGGRSAVINLDAGDTLEAWAQSGAATAALLRASERCIDARAALATNANTTLAVESALVTIARLASPPLLTASV